MFAADTHDPGFIMVDVITKPGRFHNDSGVGKARDIHLTLPRANGFDDNDLKPRGVKHLGE